MTAPKRGFTVHWNGPPANVIGHPHDRCQSFWAGVKAFHMSPRPGIPHGWSDIAYSFGVCHHGIFLTGRGWDKNQFANGHDDVGADDGPDSEWYSVLCFIGEGETPNEGMLIGLENVIHTGRHYGHCGDLIYPHWAWKHKTCPGPDLTRWAAKWTGRPFTHMTPPNPSQTRRHDMMLVQNDQTQGGNGAVLHLLGGDAAVLIDNPADFGDFKAAGIPCVPVKPTQFKRYEAMRIDV